MGEIAVKFKEVLFSVLPITVIVILLHVTITPMRPLVFIQFLIGTVLIIFGLTTFLIGVEVGITPIGNTVGSVMTRSGKLWIVVIAGLVLGFFISFAEPDLHILAEQVSSVTGGIIAKMMLIGAVSLGVALMLSLGLVRIMYNLPLYIILIVLYGIIFALALFVSPAFLAISFDSSGATTGALTVPFILAIAIGVSHLKKDSKASEKDSFGLVAIASSGAIITVMIMSIFLNVNEINGSFPQRKVDNNTVMGIFCNEFPRVFIEVVIAMVPILIIFMVFQRVAKLPARIVRRTIVGMIFTFVGLVLFLVGVNAGFMDVAAFIGKELALMGNPIFVIAGGFMLGLVTILAEPAINVLTHQVEEVTSGYVNRKVVMVGLCLGVSMAVGLSVMRVIVPGLQLWHYLLPGYVISIGLMFVVPKLFVGIAFDAGGVASGPMTATFILAYIQGAADTIDGADVLVDGFGMIATVAMMPLLTLQLLGLLFKIKSRKINAERYMDV